MANSTPAYIYLDDKSYLVDLHRVFGAAGSEVYHVLMNRYYIGTLSRTKKWIFHGKVFEDIGEDLANVILVIS